MSVLRFAASATGSAQLRTQREKAAKSKLFTKEPVLRPAPLRLPGFHGLVAEHDAKFGIGHGDEVISSPYTFVATFSAMVYAGATPVFADIDVGTHNLDPVSAETKITPKTKAIMVPALGGCPPDLDAFREICSRYGLKLIIDAAQSVGAMWKGKNISFWGDAASISFQNSKNMTCGEGGAILTNDDALAANIRTMLDGGAEDGVYTHVGYQAYMGEFQAAVISAQFEKHPAEMYQRERSFQYLRGRLKALDFVEGIVYDERITRHSCAHMALRFVKEKLDEKGVTKDQMIKAIGAEGVWLHPGYKPLYTFPCVSTGYTQKMIGAKIDVTPLPVCERITNDEGFWIGQDMYLKGLDCMDLIVEALIKVWAEAETLRDL